MTHCVYRFLLTLLVILVMVTVNQTSFILVILSTEIHVLVSTKNRDITRCNGRVLVCYFTRVQYTD